MSEKENNEYVARDFTTNDKKYNLGLILIKEYGYLLVSENEEVNIIACAII